MEHYTEFLPISRADMEARGWDQLDFVVVGGDAYVDHPSFGTAIISRLLEAEGYKVGVLAQPRYTDCEDFKRFGKPKYGFFIGGGNVDSMVSHYSVAKIPRAEDEYSPGGKGGARPDRSATVYTRLAKQAYPDLPVILGGLEASLRRFAHYDYWLDTVLPSIAEDSGADIISFGMGEHQTVEIARRLYDVPHAVARLYDSSHERTYLQLGIDYVCGTTLVAEEIFSKAISGIGDHIATFGDFEVLQFALNLSEVGQKSIKVADLESRHGIRVCAFERADGTVSSIPSPSSILYHGDAVLAVVSHAMLPAIAKYAQD